MSSELSKKSTMERKYLKQLGLIGLCVGILYLEKKRPLRSEVEPKVIHDTRNLVVAGLSALTIQMTEEPLTRYFTRRVEEDKIGLLPRLPIPPAMKTVLSIVLLDYTLYLWHVLTHKVSFLWRFHEVHHEDLDLTATTAIRFHFAEMAISAIYRSLQVILIGVTRSSLKLWQSLTLAEIIFHHSNIQLPLRLEKVLSRFIVTPRVHAIHHSAVRRETDSNWSSGLTIWDWIHGTLRLDVDQSKIQIGVPAYAEAKDVKWLSIMKKPFVTQKMSWEFDQQNHPKRSHSLVGGTLEFKTDRFSHA